MFKRVLTSGWLNFKRGGLISAATILVMTLTLIVIQGLVFFTVIADTLLNQVADKVDISVYFKTDAEEEEILNIKKEASKLSEVEQVEYVSREAALLTFKEKYKDNELLNQALEELGNNPLEASLNVRARDPRQYASVAKFFEAERFKEVVSKVNYSENQKIIDRLASIIAGVRRIGLGITLVLVVISVLVAFNTVRLAIYNAREEIGIMKLVGATNWFVRGPFVIEGILHGSIAGMLTILLFVPATAWMGPKFENFFGGVNMFSYLSGNFFETLGILVGTGVFLGVISSLIAVRRHLRV